MINFGLINFPLLLYTLPSVSAMYFPSLTPGYAISLDSINEIAFVGLSSKYIADTQSSWSFT